MGVNPEDQRPIDIHRLAIIHHSLGNRPNVLLVKTAIESAASVPRSAKGDALLYVIHIWRDAVIMAHQFWNIDQIRLISDLSCPLMYCHLWLSCTQLQLKTMIKLSSTTDETAHWQIKRARRCPQQPLHHNQIALRLQIKWCVSWRYCCCSSPRNHWYRFL